MGGSERGELLRELLLTRRDPPANWLDRGYVLLRPRKELSPGLPEIAGYGPEEPEAVCSLGMERSVTPGTDLVPSSCGFALTFANRSRRPMKSALQTTRAARSLRP